MLADFGLASAVIASLPDLRGVAPPFVTVDHLRCRRHGGLGDVHRDAVREGAAARAPGGADDDGGWWPW
jgi:hypothetical protein